jgi:hypothetical protein
VQTAFEHDPQQLQSCVEMSSGTWRVFGQNALVDVSLMRDTSGSGASKKFFVLRHFFQCVDDVAAEKVRSALSFAADTCRKCVLGVRTFLVYCSPHATNCLQLLQCFASPQAYYQHLALSEVQAAYTVLLDHDRVVKTNVTVCGDIHTDTQLRRALEPLGAKQVVNVNDFLIDTSGSKGGSMQMLAVVISIAAKEGLKTQLVAVVKELCTTLQSRLTESLIICTGDVKEGGEVDKNEDKLATHLEPCIFVYVGGIYSIEARMFSNVKMLCPGLDSVAANITTNALAPDENACHTLSSMQRHSKMKIHHVDVFSGYLLHPEKKVGLSQTCFCSISSSLSLYLPHTHSTSSILS